MANIIQKLVYDKVGLAQLERMADLAALRHKLLSSNVANATTPGYARRDIDFQQELSQALHKRRLAPRVTRPEHLTSRRTAGAPEGKRLSGGTNASGVSEVDIDQEMAQLAINTLNYETGMTMISKTFRGLRLAIRGRQ